MQKAVGKNKSKQDSELGVRLLQDLGFKKLRYPTLK